MSLIQVNIQRIEIDAIPRNWPWISQLLAPAIQLDPHRTISQVHRGLLSGEMGIATVHARNGAGLVIVEPGMFDGVFALWLPYISGKVRGGPRQFIGLMRSIMAHFEAVGRNAGCEEVRIGGRDYSRVFPDFEPFDGAINGMKKRIV